jgi:hypothetical protein
MRNYADRTGLDGESLVRASRLAAAPNANDSVERTRCGSFNPWLNNGPLACRIEHESVQVNLETIRNRIIVHPEKKQAAIPILNRRNSLRLWCWSLNRRSLRSASLPLPMGRRKLLRIKRIRVQFHVGLNVRIVLGKNLFSL